MLKADSAGLSLLNEEGGRFYWPAIAGAWFSHLGGSTPRDFRPCGDVLDRIEPMLFTRWEQRYAYLSDATPLAGRVHVSWRIDRTSTPEILRLNWRETGGPPVVEPEREGFGLTTLKRGLAIELDGAVIIDFTSAGLVCTMGIPLFQRGS